MLFFVTIVTACLVGVSICQFPPYNETCVQGTYPPHSSERVKEYIINLDDAPINRWTQLAQEKKKEIRAILTSFKGFIDEFGILAEEAIYFVDLFGASGKQLGRISCRVAPASGKQLGRPAFVDTLPQPYQDEIKGISKASGIEVGEIALYNIFYELFTVCTSVVAEDSSGKLYHARNLDFGLFMGWDILNRTWQLTEVLRPSIVNLNFQRQGKTVFKSVNFAGYVGILTAISPGKFTMTINERFNVDGGYRGIIDLILKGKGTWMGFLTRETMETAQSFNEAKKMLSDTLMIAPAFFILAGNTSGQACVITRNREVNGTDIWWMKSAGHWYILETNYDHWDKPMFLDDRRTPANRCMKKLSQKRVGIPGMFDVLSSKPVLNKLTTYTALMQVDSGHIETWLQYCKDPCSPW